MNHPNDDQLVLYHYGEAAGRNEVAEHLEVCESCRANYQALQRVLAAVETLPVPERVESYGAEVWRQVRPQIAKPAGARESNFWRVFPWPRWALAGGSTLRLGSGSNRATVDATAAARPDEAAHSLSRLSVAPFCAAVGGLGERFRASPPRPGILGCPALCAFSWRKGGRTACAHALPRASAVGATATARPATAARQR